MATLLHVCLPACPHAWLLAFVLFQVGKHRGLGYGKQALGTRMASCAIFHVAPSTSQEARDI